MNNPTLSENDYVSVLPRIIDPNMQFTKESIANTLDNKNTGTVCKIDENTNGKVQNTTSNTSVIKNTIEEVSTTTGTSFFTEYKYVILIIVIVIITIVIIYFIYKYYKLIKYLL